MIKKIKSFCFTFMFSTLIMLVLTKNVEALTINNITQTGDVNCVYSSCDYKNFKSEKEQKESIDANVDIPITDIVIPTEKNINRFTRWFRYLPYFLVGTGISGGITWVIHFRKKLLNQQSDNQKRIEVLEEIMTKNN